MVFLVCVFSDWSASCSFKRMCRRSSQDDGHCPGDVLDQCLASAAVSDRWQYRNICSDRDGVEQLHRDCWSRCNRHAIRGHRDVQSEFASGWGNFNTDNRDEFFYTSRYGGAQAFCHKWVAVAKRFGLVDGYVLSELQFQSQCDARVPNCAGGWRHHLHHSDNGNQRL